MLVSVTRLVAMVRFRSSFIDDTREGKFNADLLGRVLGRKLPNEAKGPGLGYLESYSRTPR
jgi:hypothetical protein